MGITEDTKNWAANLDVHAKRMFGDTKNPYYVVAAIASARAARFTPPPWAVEILLAATTSAFFAAQRVSKNVSIDAALGLKTGRGGTPAKLRAMRSSGEHTAFRDVEILRLCFDLSIPEACELVYHEPDFNFARDMEESISGAWSISDDDLSKIGMTRAEHDLVVEKARLRDEEILNSPMHNDQVRKKLRSGDYLSITTGDRLGYELDTFIEKFYRRNVSEPSQEDARKEQLSAFFDGVILIYSHTTRSSCCGDVPAEMLNRDPLRGIRRRAEFQRHLDVFAGSK